MGRPTTGTRRDRLVRDAALARGKNMNQVACEMGVSQATLNDLLLTDAPRNVTLARIAKWLQAQGVNVTALDLRE